MSFSSFSSASPHLFLCCVVAGPNVKAVATAVEQIYPFVFESRKEIL